MDHPGFVRSLSLTLGSLALVLSSACAAQRAPAESPSPGANVDPAALQAPPVYSLLGYRDRLELTSQQVERLDSIGQALQSARGELSPTMAGRARSGRGAPQPTPEMAATMDSLTQVHGAAVTAVEQTLTDRQRELVCELGRAETTPAREGTGQGRRLYGQGAGGRGATLFTGGRYMWPWCRPAAPERDANHPDDSRPAPADNPRPLQLFQPFTCTGGTRSCDWTTPLCTESYPCGTR